MSRKKIPLHVRELSKKILAENTSQDISNIIYYLGKPQKENNQQIERMTTDNIIITKKKVTLNVYQTVVAIQKELTSADIKILKYMLNRPRIKTIEKMG